MEVFWVTKQNTIHVGLNDICVNSSLYGSAPPVPTRIPLRFPLPSVLLPDSGRKQ